MRKIENHCVGCEMCFGCGKDKTNVLICEDCKDYADFETSIGDFCEHHFEIELNCLWEDLSIEEKAELFGIKIY